MPYTIYNADGTSHVIPDNTIDTTYYNSASKVGVQLPGLYVVNYGQPVAQNFLQLMENFAAPNPPPDGSSVLGQLWFNTSNLTMYVRINNNTSGGSANWSPLGGGTSGTLIPWFDPNGTSLTKALTNLPFGASPSDYVQIYDASNTSIGYLKVAADSNMPNAVSDAAAALIGYGYPA